MVRQVVSAGSVSGVTRSVPSYIEGNCMRYAILLMLLAFPFVEGMLLLHAIQSFGPWVFAWLILATLTGVVLIKQARFALLARFAAELAQGRFSLAALIDSARTVVAGLLLVFPGLISDLFALALLMLPMPQPKDLVHSGPQSRAPVRHGNVIDGEFRRD
jgi:UPF0716 protein FxsA